MLAELPPSLPSGHDCLFQDASPGAHTVDELPKQLQIAPGAVVFMDRIAGYIWRVFTQRQARYTCPATTEYLQTQACCIGNSPRVSRISAHSKASLPHRPGTIATRSKPQ